MELSLKFGTIHLDNFTWTAEIVLLYLWENLKKWNSFDEMRGHQSGHGSSYKDKRGFYGPAGSEAIGNSDFHYQQHERGADFRREHFYPEGGWGWIICACAFLAHVTTSGAILSAGALHIVLSKKFQPNQISIEYNFFNSNVLENSIDNPEENNILINPEQWLGPLTWSISCFCSPLVVNLCRWKNVRVLALIGGFLFPISLLLSSFATELHQFFFTFGLLGGIGSCLVRESSNMVLGEYFRRRRYFVEQVSMAGTGVGVTLFSLLYLSLGRHVDWGTGFRIGAAMTTICALLPAFYRPVSSQHGPMKNRSYNLLIPLGGDICYSLRLFCVPSLQPILWSAVFSAFGIYAPLFLMSDFGRREGLSGGSLLLLQTHLGLGISLGVILGAILALKKCQKFKISPRVICCCSSTLLGLSEISISTVRGYYGYSMSAWVYGIALGAHLYSLKILTMELTRTKHWERFWSLINALMAPVVMVGSILTAYFGKPGFYLCATCMLLSSGLIGFQLVDLTGCGSPNNSASSEDSDKDQLPPAPPPIQAKNRLRYPINNDGGGGINIISEATMNPTPQSMMGNPGLNPNYYFPLRKSISLQQPLYPEFYSHHQQPPFQQQQLPPVQNQYFQTFSPYCNECVNPPVQPQRPPSLESHRSWISNRSEPIFQNYPMARSLSLPPPPLDTVHPSNSNLYSSKSQLNHRSRSKSSLGHHEVRTAPTSPSRMVKLHARDKVRYGGSLERNNLRRVSHDHQGQGHRSRLSVFKNQSQGQIAVKPNPVQYPSNTSTFGKNKVNQRPASTIPNTMTMTNVQFQNPPASTIITPNTNTYDLYDKRSSIIQNQNDNLPPAFTRLEFDSSIQSIKTFKNRSDPSLNLIQTNYVKSIPGPGKCPIMCQAKHYPVVPQPNHIIHNTLIMKKDNPKPTIRKKPEFPASPMGPPPIQELRSSSTFGSKSDIIYASTTATGTKREEEYCQFCDIYPNNYNNYRQGLQLHPKGSCFRTYGMSKSVPTLVTNTKTKQPASSYLELDDDDDDDEDGEKLNNIYKLKRRNTWHFPKDEDVDKNGIKFSV